MVSASVAETDVQPSGDSKDRLGIFFHLELMIFCTHTMTYQRDRWHCLEMENAIQRLENVICLCDKAGIQQSDKAFTKKTLDLSQRTERR